MDGSNARRSKRVRRYSRRGTIDPEAADGGGSGRKGWSSDRRRRQSGPASHVNRTWIPMRPSGTPVSGPHYQEDREDIVRREGTRAQAEERVEVRAAESKTVVHRWICRICSVGRNWRGEHAGAAAAVIGVASTLRSQLILRGDRIGAGAFP